MLLALTVPVLVAVREFIEAPTNLLDVTIKAYERGELPVNDDELANFTRVQEMEQCVWLHRGCRGYRAVVLTGAPWRWLVVIAGFSST